MATAGDWKLTDSEISSLATVIAAETLETVALKYLGIQWEDVDNLKTEHRGDVQAFNREILRIWARKNPEPDQVKVLASMLYMAAREGGYVNVEKVQEILGVPPPLSGQWTDEFVTEGVAELIRELKDYIEETSATPLVPWVDDYIVNMKDTYVDLSIEKIENKMKGPEFKKVENYAELLVESKKRGGKGRRKKVLAKGDPGMGKSTFGMKVAFDWATGVFIDVSIVFPVSLKFVRPGDSIENIIIQQTPRVEALGITEQKLKHILETFGSRALIILDGLDEHELGSNEDIQKIIEGRKLLRSNILLTSRPHSTAKIERYFSTVVKIEGFTRDQARSFVVKHLKDTDKVEHVLRLNSHNFMSKESTHFCPMLLLFICVLVNEDELPLTQKVVYLGEIYTRLVRCIYRKYCVWKEIEFDQGRFEDVLKRLGKVAWEMLQTKKGCARRKELIKDVGDDTFEYGLLVGEKGYKLVGKETGDIFLTFIHRTIQEFLGAFFVILTVDDGKTEGHKIHGTVPQEILPFFQVIDDREKEEILREAGIISHLLVYQFFFQICMWLLSDECEKSYFSFPNRTFRYQKFVFTTVTVVGHAQLDFVDVCKIYPSIDMRFAPQMKDNISLRFIQDVLSACRSTKELYLSSLYPNDWLLQQLCHLLPSLQVIGDKQVAEKLHLEEVNDENNIVIVENTRRYDEVRKILTVCEAANKVPSLYLLAEYGKDINVAELMSSSIGKLYLFRNMFLESSKISVQSDIQHCPFLTELSLVKLNIEENVLTALSTAVRNGKLPRLSHLSFEGCRPSLKGKLSCLFDSEWPVLASLNLHQCELDQTDIRTLGLCLYNQENRLLPRLTSLTLYFGEVNTRDVSSPNIDAAVQEMFQVSAPNITSLRLHVKNEVQYESIVSGLNQGHFPCLAKLHITMMQSVDSLTQTKTTDDNFVRTLTDFTLQRYICSQKHLLAMAKSVKCSKLKKLDISHSSGITGRLFVLVGHSFPSLNSLILKDCGLSSQDLRSLAQARVKGRLPELRHLDVSQNPELVGQLRNLFAFNEWQQLLTLNTQQDKVTDTDLQTLINQVRLGCLSSLQELRVSAKSADCLSRHTKVPWWSLQQLHLLCESGLGRTTKILETVRGAVTKKLFPKLCKLYLTSLVVKSRTESIAALVSPQTQSTDMPSIISDSGLMQGLYHHLSPSILKEYADGQTLEGEIEAELDQWTDHDYELSNKESDTVFRFHMHSLGQSRLI